MLLSPVTTAALPSPKQVLDPAEIAGTAAAAQNPADIRVGDQAAGIVDHDGISGLADFDRCNHVPDQFQVHVGNGNAGSRKVSCDRDPHIGFGIVVILDRAVPGLVGTRANDGGIGGHVDASACPVQVQPGYEDTFSAGLIDQRDRDDRGHLLQQAQRVDPAPGIVIAGPRKLHRPAKLVADPVGESLYPVRRQARLDPEDFTDMAALVAIAEPALDRRANDEGHDRGDKQGREILPEQRAPREVPPRRPKKEDCSPATDM